MDASNLQSSMYDSVPFTDPKTQIRLLRYCEWREEEEQKPKGKLGWNLKGKLMFRLRPELFQDDTDDSKRHSETGNEDSDIEGSYYERSEDEDSDDGEFDDENQTSASYEHFVDKMADDDQHHRNASYELSVHSLADAPAYDAISYVWGEENDGAFVAVNGTTIQVRASLAYALLQSRLQGSQYVWIDAVCINQCAAAEKSVQVARMYEIYAEANRVLACIGYADKSSIRLLRLLPEINDTAKRDLEKQIREYCNQVRDGWGTLDTVKHDLQEMASPNWIWSGWYVHDTNLKERDLKERIWYEWAQARRRLCNKLCTDYDQLNDRPYFHRLWTMQELFAGKSRVYALVGAHSFCLQLWKHVNNAIRCLYQFDLVQKRKEGRADQSQGVYIPGVTSPEYPKFPPLDLFEFTKNGLDPCPVGLLRHTLDLQCHDPRDRVYGTIGLLRERHISSYIDSLVPDYSKSAFELAVELALLSHNADGFSFDDLFDVVRALEIQLHDPSLVPMSILSRYAVPAEQSPRRKWSMMMSRLCTLDEVHPSHFLEPDDPMKLVHTFESISNAYPSNIRDADYDHFELRCDQMEHDGAMSIGIGSNGDCLHWFVGPEVARPGDTVLVPDPWVYTRHCVGLLVRMVAESNEVVVLGFVSCIEQKTKTRWKNYKAADVTFHASVEEMMVLALPPGRHRSQAYITFRPPCNISVTFIEVSYMSYVMNPAHAVEE